jgi:PAS domain-containing protein
MRDHYSGDAETYDVEYRIERADGSYMWVRDIGRITERTADGEPRLVTGAVVDAAEALDDELL